MSSVFAALEHSGGADGRPCCIVCLLFVSRFKAVAAQPENVEMMGLDMVARLLGNPGYGFGHRTVIEVSDPTTLAAYEAVLMAVVTVRIVRRDNVVLAPVEQVQARQNAEILQQFQGAEDGSSTQSGFLELIVERFTGKWPLTLIGNGANELQPRFGESVSGIFEDADDLFFNCLGIA